MIEPRRHAIRLLFVVATLAFVSACDGGDDGTGPASTGELEVTAATTGDEPDPDGYTVTVKGVWCAVFCLPSASSDQSLGVNASVTFGSLSPGDYFVELTGAAANCTVAGSNPRSVTVSAGASASTTFNIACSSQTGSIEVTATTTGDDVDPDGYTVTVDGGAGQDKPRSS